MPGNTTDNSGVSVALVIGIQMHAMVYCGVPPAVEGFRCLREVFAEMGMAE